MLLHPEKCNIFCDVDKIGILKPYTPFLYFQLKFSKSQESGLTYLSEDKLDSAM
jgi:hypothetical protein